MNEILIGLAAFLLITLLAGLIRVLRGPTAADRMTAAQLFGTTGVAIILLLAEALARILGGGAQARADLAARHLRNGLVLAAHCAQLRDPQVATMSAVDLILDSLLALALMWLAVRILVTPGDFKAVVLFIAFGLLMALT